jgi:hypothetical protein
MRPEMIERDVFIARRIPSTVNPDNLMNSGYNDLTGSSRLLLADPSTQYFASTETTVQAPVSSLNNINIEENGKVVAQSFESSIHSFDFQTNSLDLSLNAQSIKSESPSSSVCSALTQTTLSISSGEEDSTRKTYVDFIFTKRSKESLLEFKTIDVSAIPLVFTKVLINIPVDQNGVVGGTNCLIDDLISSPSPSSFYSENEKELVLKIPLTKTMIFFQSNRLQYEEDFSVSIFSPIKEEHQVLIESMTEGLWTRLTQIVNAAPLLYRILTAKCNRVEFASQEIETEPESRELESLQVMDDISEKIEGRHDRYLGGKITSWGQIHQENTSLKQYFERVFRNSHTEEEEMDPYKRFREPSQTTGITPMSGSENKPKSTVTWKTIQLTLDLEVITKPVTQTLEGLASFRAFTEKDRYILSKESVMEIVWLMTAASFNTEDNSFCFFGLDVSIEDHLYSVSLISLSHRITIACTCNSTIFCFRQRIPVELILLNVIFFCYENKIFTRINITRAEAITFRN